MNVRCPGGVGNSKNVLIHQARFAVRSLAICALKVIEWIETPDSVLVKIVNCNVSQFVQFSYEHVVAVALSKGFLFLMLKLS